MPYDCSVTKRKGCNYCLRGKELSRSDSELSVWIDDNDCNGNARMRLKIDGIGSIDKSIHISYCPICGKKLH